VKSSPAVAFYHQNGGFAMDGGEAGSGIALDAAGGGFYGLKVKSSHNGCS
jgi:hypothetical protein